MLSEESVYNRTFTMNIHFDYAGTVTYFVNNPWFFMVIVLLYIFTFLLSLMLSGPNPGKNPFSASHIKPVEDLVTDRLTRDKVLKQSEFGLIILVTLLSYDIRFKLISYRK